MTLKKRINRHKKFAMDALEVDENSRNNDWDLIFTSLTLNGVDISEEQQKAIKSSGINIHTLIRERRYIQKSGLYPPTNPEVLKKRRLLAADYAEHYSEN